MESISLLNSSESTLNSSVKPFENIMTFKTNGSLDLRTNPTIIGLNISKTNEEIVNVSGFGSHFYYLSFGAILAFILIILLTLIIIRKKRYDKLRHHLMPVYKFDPTEESGEDWETELLDGLTSSLTHGSTLRTSRQLYTSERHERPKLSFAKV